MTALTRRSGYSRATIQGRAAVAQMR